MVQKSGEITLIGRAFDKGLAQQRRIQQFVTVLEANQDTIAGMNNSREIPKTTIMDME